MTEQHQERETDFSGEEGPTAGMKSILWGSQGRPPGGDSGGRGGPGGPGGFKGGVEGADWQQ